MAITVETSAHAGWGRWHTQQTQQQPSPEFVMADASEMMEYDSSRPTNPVPLQVQRAPVTPPFIVNNSYSMAPMINLPASHYPQSHFGFEQYGPTSPNPAGPFRQQHFQDGLPSLRLSPGESRKSHHDPISVYPHHERPHGCADGHEPNHSSTVKGEAPHQISTPASLSPTNTPSAESKIIPPNVDGTGASRIAFFTEVDSLMRAVQLDDEDSKGYDDNDDLDSDDGEKRPTDDRGESYYPSPPHVDHTSMIEDDLKAANSRDDRNVDKPHVCRTKRCGRRFTQKTHLDTHRRTHTGEKPFQCSIAGCGRWFSQRGNLKVHEDRHLGVKPFACELCDKRFHQHANLRAHIDTHSGIKRFACRLDGCTKRFGQRGNLKNHLNKFHPVSLAAWEEKFRTKPAEHLTPAELDMRKYFATQFRNSNKGIKGRGVGRHVKTVAEMVTTPTTGGGGNINMPSHHPPHPCHGLPPPTTQQLPVPMHLSLPHPHPTVVNHMGAFPTPHYGMPTRNDHPHQGHGHGHGGMPGSRGNPHTHHGTYEVYDMSGHSGMDQGHHGSNPTAMVEDDRHRGLGFQDRFHDRFHDRLY